LALKLLIARYETFVKMIDHSAVSPLSLVAITNKSYQSLSMGTENLLSQHLFKVLLFGIKSPSFNFTKMFDCNLTLTVTNFLNGYSMLDMDAQHQTVTMSTFHLNLSAQVNQN
jgi:hypothetical protein